MVKKEILLTQQSAINYLEYSKADYFNFSEESAGIRKLIRNECADPPFIKDVQAQSTNNPKYL